MPCVWVWPVVGGTTSSNGLPGAYYYVLPMYCPETLQTGSFAPYMYCLQTAQVRVGQKYLHVCPLCAFPNRT